LINDAKQRTEQLNTVQQLERRVQEKSCMILSPVQQQHLILDDNDTGNERCQLCVTKQ